MLGCKQNVNAPLILWLYIMVLVCDTVKNFKGSCEVSHQVYWPFIDNEAYLARESSSTACRVSRPNSPGMFLGFSYSTLPILIWDFIYYRALKFLASCISYFIEHISLEIVPPGSPVPLEVIPPSSRRHHGPSFTSSSNVIGNLPAFTYTSNDLILIPFVMLLNFKS